MPTGARQSSRKIGKLKAAVLQLGFHGFQLPILVAIVHWMDL
ncbi:hypothetical protein Lpp225_2299 [Lacticaseibacillus paracasei subsp. paracasei Lpp225]|uniref:Uncharacterized protein n=1 Tax=Lacticaseibacillus paracasei subsp. paracasei Lpp225 TaxID=1256225 RepID=S2N7N1_LACPA|nr:hypothetical protein Lpp225_2299 [Lacticaseibacillus paracasei subsp. paracasei Lpp225]